VPVFQATRCELGKFFQLLSKSGRLTSMSAFIVSHAAPGPISR
jgi:hypothetical protein